MSGSSLKLPEPAHVDRDDGALLGPLREGDERVFSALVDRWGGMMLRLAISHVENRAIAEGVVQEAWLTVLRSLDRFEGRSSAAGRPSIASRITFRVSSARSSCSGVRHVMGAIAQ